MGGLAYLCKKGAECQYKLKVEKNRNCVGWKFWKFFFRKFYKVRV